MLIKVDKHNIEIVKEELINEKEVNVSKCHFEFAEDYLETMVKKALFTKGEKTYEMLIANNECDYPSEILETDGTCLLGVYAFEVDGENLVKRFNPTPKKFAIELGSIRPSENSQPITPSEMEQYQQALQDGLNQVDSRIQIVEGLGEKVEQQGNKAEEQGNVAEEQGNNAQEIADEVKADKEQGKFDGKSLEFVWQGTKLGVRIVGETEYQFTDLKGQTGERGETGSPFKIDYTYANVNLMKDDFYNVEEGKYAMISGDVEKEDTAKLFYRGKNPVEPYNWTYIADFSGSKGIKGETGATPIIKIGVVTTLEPNEEASVSRSGTDEEPIFNFGIPRGLKGDKGDKGDTGEKGEQGIPGKDGEVIQQEEIDKLQSEIDDLEGILDKETSTGTNTLSYDKSKAYKVFEGVYEGNEYQETTKGINIFTNDLSIGRGTGISYSKSTDMFTFHRDGGTDYIINSKMLPLKANTTYTLYFNVSENTMSEAFRRITISSNFISGSFSIPANATGKFIGILKTGETFNELYDLWLYCNSTGTLKAKVMLIEGEYTLDTIPSYEPYTNGPSPNPDYPQEVETLKGYNLTLIDQIENLTDYATACYSYSTGDKLKIFETIANLPKDTDIFASWEFVGDGTSVAGTSGNRITIYYQDNSTTLFTNHSSFKIDGSKELKSVYLYGNQQATSNNWYKIQFTKGTTEKLYLPYNSIGIKRVGNNLFNLPKNASGYDIYIPNPIKKTGTYTISCQEKYPTAGKGVAIAFASDIGKIDGGYMAGYELGNSTKTKTNPITQNMVDKKYMVIRPSESTTYDKLSSMQIQLEENSVATEYEPYQERIDYIDLQGNEILKEDNLTVDSKGNVKLVKNWGKVVLDGSEANWSKVGNCYQLGIPFPSDGNVFRPTTKAYCDYFKYQYYASGITANQKNGEFGWDSQKYLTLRIDRITDIILFKQWLGENKPIVYYQLATPIEITLGTIEPIRSLEGTNNVEVLATLEPTSMSETYVYDLKKEVEEIKQLLVNATRLESEVE